MPYTGVPISLLVHSKTTVKHGLHVFAAEWYVHLLQHQQHLQTQQAPIILYSSFLVPSGSVFAETLFLKTWAEGWSSLGFDGVHVFIQRPHPHLFFMIILSRCLGYFEMAEVPPNSQRPYSLIDRICEAHTSPLERVLCD